MPAHRIYLTEEARLEAQRENKRRWVERNRERKKEQALAWYYRNHEACLQSSRERHQANKDREAANLKAWRSRNPERSREQVREWRAANPLKTQASVRVSNHRRRGVPLDATGKAYVAVLRCDPCSYCGGRTEHIDHIDSIKSGGDSHWANLTAACMTCNQTKSATPLLRFMLGRRT